MLTTAKAGKMCPKCGEDTRVIDSRTDESGFVIRKRRCNRCGTGFMTRENFLRLIPECCGDRRNHGLGRK